MQRKTSLNDFILNSPTLYADNRKDSNQIIQITDKFIYIYDDKFKLLSKINTIVKPVIIKVKKTKAYIFNKNNILASYDLDNTGAEKNSS